MAQIETPIAAAGGFEVGRQALPIQLSVVSLQESGTDTAALPAGPYPQERQVVMRTSMTGR